MMFKFLNRTNGVYPDNQVWWSVKINGVTTTRSIAEQSTFDMPANSSGRVYVYLGPGTDATAANSKYFDFMEYTIGNNPPAFHGNTTRVDAFGIKLTMQMLCADGYQVTVGENAATFAEDRAVTFQRFLAQVPLEFQHLAKVQAPYRILSPDAAFNAGGQYADYYSAYIDQVWQSNGLTIPKAGPNASGLGSYPDLSAAIYRHVAYPGRSSRTARWSIQSSGQRQAVRLFTRTLRRTTMRSSGIRMPSTALPMGFPMTTLAVIPPIFRIAIR